MLRVNLFSRMPPVVSIARRLVNIVDAILMFLRNCSKRVWRCRCYRSTSGIGKAIAAQLVMVGYKVYGTSRRGASSDQHTFEMLALCASEAFVAAAGSLACRLQFLRRFPKHRGFFVVNGQSAED